jgi:hypothetical protein
MPKTRLSVFALMILAAFFLLGCEAAPKPPDHTNAWLSYKFIKRGCPVNAITTSCTELTDAPVGEGYYRDIGADQLVAPPNGTQFDAWLLKYGFGNGAPEIRAVYGNRGDLAFGRDMHCLQSGQNIACYVTNYGPPPTFNSPAGFTRNCSWGGCDSQRNKLFEFPSLEDGRAIQDAIDALSPFGTVAMVWTPNSGLPNNGNNVTFYAFSSGGALLPAVELDDEFPGLPKTLPRMCMACHGGTWDALTASVINASFLPFDMYSFKYSRDYQYDLYGQQEAFRKLNQMVLATTPPQAITDFITGSYPKGVGNVGSIEIDNYVPPASQTSPGWAPDPELYNVVVKPYCRTCHLAMGGTLDFEDYNEFKTWAGQIDYTVCQSHDMPHAEVPYVRFWLKDKPAQEKLRDFLKSQGQTGCP